MRRPDLSRLLFRGFAPLVLAAALFVLSVLLVPSVAPEHVVVERPTTTTTATTTATTPPTTTPPPSSPAVPAP
jgi:hypothetical protein